jgi:hypothetical protein
MNLFQNEIENLNDSSFSGSGALIRIILEGKAQRTKVENQYVNNNNTKLVTLQQHKPHVHATLPPSCKHEITMNEMKYNN